MAIRKIRLTNFKSFNELDVELGKFNVLIGANASGKSNFLQIFQFLRDITRHGLDNAISMQGGVEYLRNISIGRSQNFSIEIVCDNEMFASVREASGLFGFMRKAKGVFIGVRPYETTYRFVLKYKARGAGFDIVTDQITQRCTFVTFVKKGRGIDVGKELGKGKITISRHNGKIDIDLDKPKDVSLKKEDILPPFLVERKSRPGTLLLEEPFLFVTPGEVFSDLSIYDFDPKLPKKATPITGKAELEEDGTNLSIVLKNIIGHKDSKRKLFNLVKDVLPFIDNLDVEKFADKSLLFKLREIYDRKHYLPASFISDGTINITAIIVALYFEKKRIVIIEEPERNIHPYLISKVISMMKDASKKKQVVITTHNPEIVKYSDLDNILLVSRDDKGFSIISKPADKEGVRTFLENEIGLEDLYVQNLLGV